MKRLNQILITSVILSLVLQACNLELVGSPADADVLLTITANAAMIEAAGKPGTEEPLPLEGDVAPPAEEVVIPAQVLPPAVGDVTVSVSVATNCRTGPGQNFKIVYGMPVGQVAKVVAKNSYSGYWIIEIPGQAGQTCWLWGQYAVIKGDTASLKDVVTPTSAATATKTPTATATFTSAPGAITGCTNPSAPNYNPAATVDDGSCANVGLPTLGCTDPLATNYDPAAGLDDGSCTYAVAKPNAPTFNGYICTVTDPDGDGVYTLDYVFGWVDNSNNEKGFTVSDSFGVTNYPPNTTQHKGTFNVPSPTFTIQITITAFNDGGSASSSAPAPCPP